MERAPQSSDRQQREPQPGRHGCCPCEERALHLFYKTAHSEDRLFDCVNFLRKKADISIILDGGESPRGIPGAKAQGIIKTLFPLMPKSRIVFWERLTTSCSTGSWTKLNAAAENHFLEQYQDPKHRPRWTVCTVAVKKRVQISFLLPCLQRSSVYASMFQPLSHARELCTC